jgi:exodeoxyribonuclease VII large subunit
VDYLEPLGLGALAQAFEALKNRLGAEGLFAPELKKPLPFLPRKIALVTSPTGAAVRDFLRLWQQRYPNVEVLIYPVKVQGTEAAGEITQALDDLAAYPGLSVIVLARGGGSLEDLWPFNEESVARAIHRCPIPVVSAVGHEVDFTIADFVADRRAPTPSAAVELVVPDKAELERRLARLGVTLARTLARRRDLARQHLGLMARRLPDGRRLFTDLRLKVDDRAEVLVRRARRVVNQQEQHLRLATSRLFLLSPRRALGSPRQRLEQLATRLGQSLCRRQAEHRRHLEYCQTHLEQLNPLAILQRGYAVATLLPEETVIRDATLVPLGANIRVQVARGRMDCEVKEASSDK